MMQKFVFCYNGNLPTGAEIHIPLWWKFPHWRRNSRSTIMKISPLAQKFTFPIVKISTLAQKFMFRYSENFPADAEIHVPKNKTKIVTPFDLFATGIEGISGRRYTVHLLLHPLLYTSSTLHHTYCSSQIFCMQCLSNLYLGKIG